MGLADFLVEHRRVLPTGFWSPGVWFTLAAVFAANKMSSKQIFTLDAPLNRSKQIF